MKIGELAKLTGLAPSRIRYYESTGLIHSSPRGSNGYREFTAETAALLALIVRAQQAGFSLEEIHHLLPTRLSGKLAAPDHEILLRSLSAKVVEIDAILQRLTHNKTQLLSIIARIEGGEPLLAESTPCDGQLGQLMDSLRVTVK